jgi:DNA primase
MRHAHFDGTENGELRAKIDEAKRRLPMPDLLQRLELGAHAKKSARCMWHDDQHLSFSVFKGRDGFWHYKCFVCDPQDGDEITFLAKHFTIPRREAISSYVKMAGFPPSATRKSHEWRKSPEYPELPESPVSEGKADGVYGTRIGPIRRCGELS